MAYGLDDTYGLDNISLGFIDNMCGVGLSISKSFQNSLSQCYKITKSKFFKINDFKQNEIVKESLIFSYVIHKFINIDILGDFFSDELLKFLCFGPFPDIIKKFYPKYPKINVIKFNLLARKREEEYGEIFTNSRRKHNLLFYPRSDINKIIWDDTEEGVFIRLFTRFCGIILYILKDKGNSIPDLNSSPMLVIGFREKVSFNAAFEENLAFLFHKVIPLIKSIKDLSISSAYGE